MDKLSLALQLILSLSILVVLHELGHYFPAKWFKTRVEKFYLFFDPYFSLFKKKIGDTEWGIGWIPFGGYVKISGMIDESMDKEQMQQPPQPWEFRSKPAWQRLIIMIGGVTVNFILGILIFSLMVFYWGESYIKVEDAKYGMAVQDFGKDLGLRDGDVVISVGGKKIEKFSSNAVVKEIVINEAKEIVVNRYGVEEKFIVPQDLVAKLTKFENKGKGLFEERNIAVIEDLQKDGPAQKAGFEKGMKIIGINNKPIEFSNELVSNLQTRKGSRVDIKVLDKNTGDTLVKPIEIPESGRIGIALQRLPISTQNFGFFESFGKGASMSVGFLSDQLKAFGQIFTGKMKAKESLGSVFSIASMFDTGWDWRVFWNITASLSILLAFFNLLPIPALDGGYVMFLLWEVITGKVPSDRFMEVVNYIGFILLISLMIFAVGLDISRLF